MTPEIRQLIDSSISANVEIAAIVQQPNCIFSTERRDAIIVRIIEIDYKLRETLALTQLVTHNNYD